MPGITVEVDATVGRTIRRDDTLTDSLPRRGRRPAGHRRPAGGQGYVADTLGDDRRPVEALVLMCEPAVPGANVRAWPVGVLHLAAPGRTVDEVLCVAEAPSFADLVDVDDLARWHAEPEAWAAVPSGLSPGNAYTVAGCGPKREAEQLLSAARPT
ncbi:inorganic diphosphatase [Streptomyces sp. NBC_01262]|uniref:inorganic diphosphatase n=1 Tax=Streptomyces sp. NBC_01262 TaxID=2903803 RepID=UPI002E348EA4|nr:inorganic diphosphatase [Streptomyces sp. NBC_01262]